MMLDHLPQTGQTVTQITDHKPEACSYLPTGARIMGKVMTTLNLPNEMEERLLQECHRLALSIPDYVALVLREMWEAEDAATARHAEPRQ